MVLGSPRGQASRDIPSSPTGGVAEAGLCLVHMIHDNYITENHHLQSESHTFVTASKSAPPPLNRYPLC